MEVEFVLSHITVLAASASDRLQVRQRTWDDDASLR